MIPVQELIGIFKRMTAENWPYASPGSNDENGIDCSGAFVYAYRQFGESIYHGSNRMARAHVVKLLPISEAKPGMAAFKLRTPGEEYYALPQGYMPGGGSYNGDLNDYYHVGLVDTDMNYVLNAKDTANGFVRSPITEKWDAVAYLSAVDYGSEAAQDGEETVSAEEPVYDSLEEAKAAVPPPESIARYVRIISPNEFPVKIREQPKKGAVTKYSATHGTLVPYEGERDGFYKIHFNGSSRYVMKEFGQIVRVRKG